MLTVACILTFPDGQKVTGTIEAHSPGLYYPIAYTGPTDRLTTRKYDTGTVSDLELLFNVTARKTGAAMEIKRSGTYVSHREISC